MLVRRPLLCFFVMAYAFSWIVWAPWVLGGDGAGLLPIRVAHPVQGYLNATAILAGPTLAALLTTAANDGRAGVRRLLARLVAWRVGLRWYALAFLGVPLIMLLATWAYARGSPNLASLGGPSYLVTYPLTYALVVVLGGPLFEEVGWRGFALPRLQRLHGPLVASLVLGVLWALWHLPEFLVPSWAASSGGGGVTGIVLFTLVAITFTVVLTWVFNHTRGSVLVAILVHASIDAFSLTLGVLYPAVTSSLPLLIGFGVVALALVGLTRGQLGHPPGGAADTS